MSALIHIRSYRGDETGGDLCWDVTCLAPVTDPPTIDRSDQDDPEPWKCGWTSRLWTAPSYAYSEGMAHLTSCPYARIERALRELISVEYEAALRGDGDPDLRYWQGAYAVSLRTALILRGQA